MRVAKVLQIYVFPLMFLVGLAAGFALHHHALICVGSVGTGFYIGVFVILTYVRQCGLVSESGARKHHDWIEHGGRPPWK